MADKPRDYEAELWRVMNALADTAAQASDEEILAQTREEGLDPETEAATVREILLGAVKKEKLREAQRRYEAESVRLQTKHFRLPQSPSDKRLLLGAFLAAQPQARGMVTAQFRELGELSDADVESSLRKFEDLGLLDKLLGDHDEE